MVQKPLGFEPYCFEMRDLCLLFGLFVGGFLISRFLDEFLQFLAGAFADVVFHQICFGKSRLFVYIKDLREKTIDDLVGIKDILGCVTACVRQGNLAVMLSSSSSFKVFMARLTLGLEIPRERAISVMRTS